MAKKITVIPAKKKSHNVNSVVDATAKIRVAAYCRVSTDREEQESSFKNQQEYYLEYIEKHDDYVLADIYADEGITATNTKKRENFKRMIKDCEAGKIDLVITKSISRFARNTQDCLFYSRKLKELRIPIVFEKEGINTMDASGELLFTILSSLAQEESRNISENCKWAIKHNFENGKPSINTTLFMGYDKDENGKLIVNEEQAKIVRRVFQLFEEGLSPSRISRIFRGEGIQGTRAGTWPPTAIRGMLENEKYAGDILMQKVYTEDFLTKKKVKNNGELPQYFMEGCHEAIIPKDEWEAVQLELKRRDAYRAELDIYAYSNDISPFASHVICKHCGRTYRRCGWARNGVKFWMCSTKKTQGAKACEAENILEEWLYKAFKVAWNGIVNSKEEFIPIWDRQIAEGNPLERMKAQQFKAQVAEGMIDEACPELIMMTLERMIVQDKRTYEVRFQDRTIKTVCIGIE